METVNDGARWTRRRVATIGARKDPFLATGSHPPKMTPCGIDTPQHIVTSALENHPSVAIRFIPTKGTRDPKVIPTRQASVPWGCRGGAVTGHIRSLGDRRAGIPEEPAAEYLRRNSPPRWRQCPRRSRPRPRNVGPPVQSCSGPSHTLVSTLGEGSRFSFWCPWLGPPGGKNQRSRPGRRLHSIATQRQKLVARESMTGACARSHGRPVAHNWGCLKAFGARRSRHLS